MTALIAGAASGLLMASVFVSAGVIMLFIMVKDPPPGLRPMLQKFRPSSLAMSVVVFGYPVWAVIGVVLGVMYHVSSQEAPGAGLGSRNVVYTTAVLVVAVMMAAPFAYLLRRVVVGVVAITLAFVGIFGWFLPFFAD